MIPLTDPERAAPPSNGTRGRPHAALYATPLRDGRGRDGAGPLVPACLPPQLPYAGDSYTLRWWNLPGGTGASVREARHLLGDLLRRCRVAQEPRDDALLVVSELVTNALCHTDSDRVHCCAAVADDRVHLEVHDDQTTSTRPLPRVPTAEDERGRGLLLVGALAERGGTAPSRYTRGDLVWATLPSATVPPAVPHALPGREETLPLPAGPAVES
ncbi:ATP-binding protein [Streptomyces sp. ODS28]|uniref:ATP-binding protein n=1 Tax=Streptomyces sp. ODS28 TaxID=3136688 RepID=UPI0031EB0345